MRIIFVYTLPNVTNMTDTMNSPDMTLELSADVDQLLQTDIENDEYSAEIPLLDTSVSYSDFFHKYLIKNRPCLLTKDFTSTWASRRNWIKDDNDHDHAEIDYQYLCTAYGDEKVCATDCQTIALHKSDTEPIEMTLREYLEYWKEFRAINANKTEATDSSSKRCLYLKDWHILRCTYCTDPSVSVPLPYDIPVYFKSDWLNEYCSELNIDDFCFCYMGPKGSWTGFHSDVYGSFSWSANVIGRKKWWIYFPNRIQQFTIKKDIGSGNSDSDAATTTAQYKYDYEHPGKEGLDYIEVIQEAGQVIFIPSGWFHVVWNLEDTISINHNWFNGSNVEFVWKSLRLALNDVERELNDLKADEEFSQLCQSLLKANHGMNYEDFMDILLFIWRRRSTHLSAIHNSSSTSTSLSTESSTPATMMTTRTRSHFASSSTFGRNHCEYDLKCIEKVVQLIEVDMRNRIPGSVTDKLLQFK